MRATTVRARVVEIWPDHCMFTLDHESSEVTAVCVIPGDTTGALRRSLAVGDLVEIELGDSPAHGKRGGRIVAIHTTAQSRQASN